MRRADKEQSVKNLHGKFGAARAAIIADFSGLSVVEMNSLRKQIREGDMEFLVVKNTLAKLALEGTDMEEIKGRMEGINAFALTEDDPVVLAKTIYSFAKEHEALKIKFGYLSVGKQNLSAEQVSELAKIPPRDVLIARFVGALGSTRLRLVNGFAGIARKFVFSLEAVRVKKEEETN